MFRYRLHSPDGDDLGEATYAQMVYPDEEIIAGSSHEPTTVASYRLEPGSSRTLPDRRAWASPLA